MKNWLGGASNGDKIHPTFSLYTFRFHGLARDWVSYRPPLAYIKIYTPLYRGFTTSVSRYYYLKPPILRPKGGRFHLFRFHPHLVARQEDLHYGEAHEYHHRQQHPIEIHF